MKPGAENRKKTVMAGVLGMVALICVVVMYNTLFGGSSTPAPVAPPVITSVPGNKAIVSSSGSAQGSSTLSANAPGVAAVKMATTSSSLDPTLDETAMLRTESLVYSGTGRNNADRSTASAAHQPEILRHSEARQWKDAGVPAAG